MAAVRRAAERGDKTANLNDTLLEQLECPVCLDTCRPPIYMCVNGHNVCSACDKKIVECPICRAPGAPSIRNIAVEHISAQILVPCPLRKAGCLTLLRLDALDAHNATCNYRHRCVLCDYAGDVASLNVHLESAHKRYYTAAGEFEGDWKIDFNKSSRIYKYLYWDAELFLCAMTYLTVRHTLYLQCRWVGAHEEAAGTYKALFFLCSEGRDLTCSYSKTCVTEEGDVERLGCVPLHRDMLELLVHSDGKLRCMFKLKKVGG